MPLLLCELLLATLSQRPNISISRPLRVGMLLRACKSRRVERLRRIGTKYVLATSSNNDGATGEGSRTYHQIGINVKIHFTPLI
ncbi:hypothetical protein E4U38_003445 [Claviceps purpurea]|nr:hypothetical protein E4U38_003445 [Claviceps purpurea]